MICKKSQRRYIAPLAFANSLGVRPVLAMNLLLNVRIEEKPEFNAASVILAPLWIRRFASSMRSSPIKSGSDVLSFDEKMYEI